MWYSAKVYTACHLIRNTLLKGFVYIADFSLNNNALKNNTNDDLKVFSLLYSKNIFKGCPI